MKIIIPPHLRPAKKVEDYKEMFNEAKQILKGVQSRKFSIPGSKYNDCFAMAQPQVSDNPLRYFVLNPYTANKAILELGGLVIINPRIVSKDKQSKTISKEACMSYPFRDQKKVKRFNNITVTYDVISDTNKPKIVKVNEKNISGLTAFIFQHELEHLNGKSIWKN